MLPQLMSLDIVVEHETNQPYLVEINGDRSGHQGFYHCYGRSLLGDIFERISHLAPTAKKYWASPNFINHTDPRHMAEIADAIQRHGIVLDLAPMAGTLYGGNAAMLHKATSGRMYDADVLLGIGLLLDTPELQERMINTTDFAFFSDTKIMQRLLVQEGIRIPNHYFVNYHVRADGIQRIIDKHGTMLYKGSNGSQGRSVNIVDGTNITTYLNNRYELMPDLVQAMMDPETRSVSIRTPDDQDSQFRLYGLVSAIMARRDFMPETVAAKSRTTGIMEEIIDPKRLKSKITGAPHFSKARIYMFDGYMGGYWTLSKERIGSKISNNVVINLTTGVEVQPFTPEDEEFMQQVAQDIQPTLDNLVQTLPTLEEQRKIVREVERKIYLSRQGFITHDESKQCLVN